MVVNGCQTLLVEGLIHKYKKHDICVCVRMRENVCKCGVLLCV